MFCSACEHTEKLTVSLSAGPRSGSAPDSSVVYVEFIPLTMSLKVQTGVSVSPGHETRSSQHLPQTTAFPHNSHTSWLSHGTKLPNQQAALPNPKGPRRPPPTCRTGSAPPCFRARKGNSESVCLHKKILLMT